MPNVRNLHTDAALTNFAVRRPQGSMAALQIAPILQVKKMSDVYYRYGNEHITDDVIQSRAPGGVASEFDFKVSTSPYVCREYPVRRLVPDQERDNADAAIDVFEWTTAIAQGKVMLAWEKRMKTLATTAGNFGTVVTAANPWSDITNGDPEKDIDDAKEGVRVKAGLEPNIIVIPPHMALELKRHPKIVELIKYTQQDRLVNGDLPPRLFNLTVVIPGATQNTANIGQTESISRVWNNDSVQVLYVDGSTTTQSNTWARTFRWSMFGVAGQRVKRYRNEDRDGTFIEYGLHQTEHLVNSGAGSLITGI